MNFKRPLILASNSPRRQYLMRELGYQFTVRQPNGDESFPSDMAAEMVPVYLARKKAESINAENDEVILTSDTVVILNNKILNKPLDRDEAIGMLSALSGNTHTVITAFCLKDANRVACFHNKTRVTFHKLSLKEIENYVDQFQPYDKAGAYGAQDCLSKGVNPCAEEEINFLQKMGKLDLIEKTFTDSRVGTGVLAIQKIEGSYFNVMGLPIHEVYYQLETFQDKTD